MFDSEETKAAVKRKGRPKKAKESPVAAEMAPAGEDGGLRDVDQIYETLRNAVLTQRLTPGTQLKEQALADTFGVNRSVVRQALARLEMSRLVEHFPNRGVFVATPTVAESRDLFAARRAIEAAILGVLLERRDRPSLATLRANVEKEQDAYRRGELRQALMLSVEFHRELARVAGNSVLAAFLEELVARTPLVMLYFRGVDSPSCALKEHSDILDAIEAGDRARAIAIMDEHLSHQEEKLDLDGSEANNDLASLLGLDVQKV